MPEDAARALPGGMPAARPIPAIPRACKIWRRFMKTCSGVTSRSEISHPRRRWTDGISNLPTDDTVRHTYYNAARGSGDAAPGSFDKEFTDLNRQGAKDAKGHYLLCRPRRPAQRLRHPLFTKGVRRRGVGT